MNFAIGILVSFVFASSVFATTEQIASITKLKGEITLTRNQEIIPVTLQTKVFERDIIETQKSSYIKILFEDRTTLLLGPSSKSLIEKFSSNDTKIINLMKGSFRVKVNKKNPNDHSTIFKTDQVSLAIRGTEFLTNAYLVNAKSVTDTVLLEGIVDTTITNSKSFTLEAGQVFNTSQLAAGQPIAKLTSAQLEHLLNSSDSLLPNIQNIDGSFNDIKESIKSSESSISTPSNLLPIPVVAGVAATAAIVIKSEDKNSPQQSISNKNEKEDDKLDLTKLPWSIRDAILKDREYKKENICFYWFFKKLPGAGEEELFRRERDCEEYEYEL